MRVLVTGATGFLGFALASQLRTIGYEVFAHGRNSDVLRALGDKGITALRGDLTSATPFQLSELPSEIDAVIHTAALSSPWGKRSSFMRTNLDGTHATVALAQRLNASKFVFISSPTVYFKFADQFGVSEAATLPASINAYAESKQLAEQAVLACGDFSSIVLRPRGLYGKGDTTLLPRLVRAASERPLPLMRDGVAVTDLTHIDDVVDASIAAMQTEINSHATKHQRIFNISGGVALNVKEVVQQVARQCGVQVRWRRMPVSVVLSYARAAEAIAKMRKGYPEPAITAYAAGLFAYSQTLDISAAARVLRWQPKVSFDEGLRRRL